MKVKVQPGPAVESLPMSKGHLRTWGWQKWIHLCWQSVNHSDKGKRYLQQFWQWVKDTSDNNPYKEWAAHLSNVKVSSWPLWLRVPAKEANSGLRWSLNWWSVWFWLRLVIDRVGLGWGELRVLDQRPASRNFSLAPNHQFTHMTSHQEGLFQRK